VRKISDFRQYESSPFPISGMEQKVVTKPGKTATMVSGDGAEMYLQEAGKERSIVHDQEQYVKVFKYGLDTMKHLNQRSLCLVMMIMAHIQPRRNTVELTRAKAEAFSSKLAGASYYVAVVGLLDLGVIARTSNKKTFFVNPNMIFNGDRRGLIKTKETEYGGEVNSDHRRAGVPQQVIRRQQTQSKIPGEASGPCVPEQVQEDAGE